MAQPAPSTDKFMQALYDLTTLRRFAEQIARTRSASEARCEVVTLPAEASTIAPVLLLPGAFNPPTIAHLALAQESLRATPGAHVYFALGTAIINKESTERASLLDRLLLLDQIARRIGHLGVLLTNRGLYVDQAAAARASFPHVTDLFFIVGFDKIVQIFDAHYYQDRDAALRQLFSLARLLVVPRARYEAADLSALMNRAENQPFQAFIRLLPFPADYRDIASSQIRVAFQTHPEDLATSPLAQWLPPEALVFCIETGCYLPMESLPDGERIDRYGLRTALIGHALALPPAEQSALNLQRLFALATSAGEPGRTLRRWLSQPATTAPPFDLRTV